MIWEKYLSLIGPNCTWFLRIDQLFWQPAMGLNLGYFWESDSTDHSIFYRFRCLGCQHKWSILTEHLWVHWTRFSLDWDTRITKNVQFNTVFCRAMKPKIQYVNINTVVTVPRVVQSIIDFWQVLFICVNNTPGPVWKHFSCPSKYPKTIKISLKNLF